jgi:hypothetical protein
LYNTESARKINQASGAIFHKSIECADTNLASEIRFPSSVSPYSFLVLPSAFLGLPDVATVEVAGGLPEVALVQVLGGLLS